VNTTPSPNFAYQNARLGRSRRRQRSTSAPDPTVTLLKLRQFGEVLAQRAAANMGLFVSAEEGQQQLIDRLWDRKVIGATQRSLFHDLRRVGNAAVHQGAGDHREALHSLIPPVLRHGIAASPSGEKYSGAIWTTYAPGERLPRKRPQAAERRFGGGPGKWARPVARFDEVATFVGIRRNPLAAE
jgi:hypothetical protein